ncbi:MAG TPA: hypothetical protein VKY35_02165 [Aliidiomarina sp.]|nr:hypothetical protein [Aliidiomarina sp.]
MNVLSVPKVNPNDTITEQRTVAKKGQAIQMSAIWPPAGVFLGHCLINICLLALPLQVLLAYPLARLLPLGLSDVAKK